MIFKKDFSIKLMFDFIKFNLILLIRYN
jgi:hypothetical protein